MAITTTREWITPELAKVYLSKLRARQRPLSQGNVDKLTREMVEGRFVETHQGLAFDKDDRLIDGQHRLHAIIKAGKSFWMNVSRGLDDKAMEYMDIGQKRDESQRLMVGGLDATKKDVALIRCVICGFNGTAKGATPPISLDDLRDVFLRIAEPLKFVNTHAPVAKVHNVIRAAIVRAWYHCSAEGKLNRLEEFCRVIASNEVSSNADGAAVSLVKMAAKYRWSSVSDRRELYRLATRAILYFLNYHSPGILKPASAEEFLLPWEQADPALKVVEAS